MSQASMQFTEMVREHYALLQIGELERQEILLNIAEAELDKEITPEQAKELREYYQGLAKS
jgi:hypothetical protein